MSLGEIIRITRQKAFCTQEDFAKQLNVALSTVNRWELGKATPNMKGMKAIKAFCEAHELDYESVEAEWLNHSLKTTEILYRLNEGTKRRPPECRPNGILMNELKSGFVCF